MVRGSSPWTVHVRTENSMPYLLPTGAESRIVAGRTLIVPSTQLGVQFEA